MLKIAPLFWITVVATLASANSQANVIKEGKFLRAGSAETILVSRAQGSRGNVMLGTEEFVLETIRPNQIIASTTTLVNGKKVKDLRLNIFLLDLNESDLQSELKKMISNPDEYNCDTASNATLVLSDGIAGTVSAYCAQLN